MAASTWDKGRTDGRTTRTRPAASTQALALAALGHGHGRGHLAKASNLHVHGHRALEALRHLREAAERARHGYARREKREKRVPDCRASVGAMASSISPLWQRRQAQAAKRSKEEQRGAKDGRFASLRTPSRPASPVPSPGSAPCNCLHKVKGWGPAMAAKLSREATKHSGERPCNNMTRVSWAHDAGLDAVPKIRQLREGLQAVLCLSP